MATTQKKSNKKRKQSVGMLDISDGDSENSNDYSDNDILLHVCIHACLFSMI